MKRFWRLDLISLTTFLFCSLAGVISHLMIFVQFPGWDTRLFHKLSLGVSYDVMNAAILGTFGLLVTLLFKSRVKKIVQGMIFFTYLFFLFIDYHYVQQFGTHLPFSSIEYLEEAGNFSSTILSILTGISLWIIIIAPFAAYLIVIHKLPMGGGNGLLTSFKGIIITLVFFIIFGGLVGSYPNSYVSKNLNDPLTSSAAFYFYWSRHFEREKTVPKPIKALNVVSRYLDTAKSDQKEYDDLPLVRKVASTTCRRVQEQNELGKNLCGEPKPNILMLMLESFRAVDIGIYGSQLKVTPEFDRLAKEGIFFKNFYANGFQTRHSQVAVYCSLMPNYGAAIMKRYTKNSYYCLPELLKTIGYQNSWVFASDAAFDDQVHFLPRIGFDRLYDRFSFDSNSEILGWGYSDREMFNKWIEVLDQEKEPFFSSALTISNHHPFDVPEKYKLHRGQDDTHKYYEAMYYTDAMLGEFIKKIKIKSWYKNSLVFILADTSNYQKPQAPPRTFAEFVKIRSQIPLLILGGAVKKPMVVEDYYSQIDLAPTVMDLLGYVYTAPWAGVSMLSNRSPGIAFTNRPGNYWAVMSRYGRYYKQNETIDHYFGFADEGLKAEYRLLGKSWLELTQWMLQEDLYWRK